MKKKKLTVPFVTCARRFLCLYFEQNMRWGLTGDNTVLKAPNTTVANRAAIEKKVNSRNISICVVCFFINEDVSDIRRQWQYLRYTECLDIHAVSAMSNKQERFVSIQAERPLPSIMWSCDNVMPGRGVSPKGGGGQLCGGGGSSRTTHNMTPSGRPDFVALGLKKSFTAEQSQDVWFQCENKEESSQTRRAQQCIEAPHAAVNLLRRHCQCQSCKTFSRFEEIEVSGQKFCQQRNQTLLVSFFRFPEWDPSFGHTANSVCLLRILAQFPLARKEGCQTAGLFLREEDPIERDGWGLWRCLQGLASALPCLDAQSIWDITRCLERRSLPERCNCKAPLFFLSYAQEKNTVQKQPEIPFLWDNSRRLQFWCKTILIACQRNLSELRSSFPLKEGS